MLLQNSDQRRALVAAQAAGSTVSQPLFVDYQRVHFQQAGRPLHLSAWNLVASTRTLSCQELHMEKVVTTNNRRRCVLLDGVSQSTVTLPIAPSPQSHLKEKICTACMMPVIRSAGTGATVMICCHCAAWKRPYGCTFMAGNK